MNHKYLKLLGAAALIHLSACGGGGGSGDGATSTSLASYATNPGSLRVNLTDAPIDNVKEVNVNIKQIELNMSGATQAAKVVIGNNFGIIDLLTLRNGVMLPMYDLELPQANETTLHQVRLVLEGTDNHLIMNDGSRCDLATPSAQKTGVKVIIPGGVTFEPGYSYSLVVDFDASKSIVIQGNGGCLLKPVIKLKSFTRIPDQDDGDDNGGGDPQPSPTPVLLDEDLLDGEEPENDGDYDDGDDLEDFPDVIDPDDGGWIIY